MALPSREAGWEPASEWQTMYHLFRETSSTFKRLSARGMWGGPRSLGPPVVPLVREVLDGNDEAAKYHVLCGVVGAMEPSVIDELREALIRLSEAPTARDAEEGIPEIARNLLTQRERKQ